MLLVLSKTFEKTRMAGSVLRSLASSRAVPTWIVIPHFRPQGSTAHRFVVGPCTFGQLEGSCITAGKRGCRPTVPIPQAFLKDFSQSFVAVSHFLPPSVVELISIWKIFRVIGTNRLFQLCNYFSMTLQDACFWIRTCYVSLLRETVLPATLMDRGVNWPVHQGSV